LRTFLVFFGGLLVGCGGRALPQRGDGLPSQGGDSSAGAESSDGGGDSSAGAESSDEGIVSGGGGASIDAAPRCTVPDASRAASPDEHSQYCVCTPQGAQGQMLLWECYGPSPTAAKPQATCMYTNTDPGTNNGSCFVIWTQCSDGSDYSITCINSDCYCLVKGQRTTILEPRDSCPESKTDANALCGWNLQ
jgi:hypothetical protein